MKAKTNTTTLDQFVTKHYGTTGTSQRDKLNQGYENFKMGILLRDARKKAGLTQDELAKRAGTTKSFISKLENDVKEVRLSTLQNIVELGLGGKVEVSIKL